MSNHFLFVEVVLDQNLGKALDYAVPDEMRHAVEVGMRVEVPLNKKLAQGTISSLKLECQWPNPKPIARLISASAELSPLQWKLAYWMAEYYATSLSRVLKCFIPPSIRKQVAPAKEMRLKLLKTHAETIHAIQSLRTLSPKDAEILEECLARPGGLLLSELSVPKQALKNLIKQKLLSAQEETLQSELLFEEEFFPVEPKPLNPEQKQILDALSTSLETHQFETHLLQGITGSGKTEVYIQAIQKALDLGKSALLLVPEISLTSQTIERFRSRFPQKIAILHHRRSLGEKSAAWEELRSGKVRLAIGARSALFCPIQRLGLLIVDEEHDNSYKSDEQPCYHARDVAVFRAKLENAAVLLGSATPSIESRYNASIGKYRFHTLITRATQAPLAKVTIVDMKNAMAKQGGFSHFSQELLNAIEKRLKNGEQTLLLLNKRGYHRLQLCGACRTIVECPHCDLPLTFHRAHNLLQCHLCNFAAPPSRTCKTCGSLDPLSFKGFGTEHVERSLYAIFPEIRILRMDRDTTQKKHSHEQLFKEFRSHKADVLVGTQMIAKGFHFPSVTLVGVLSADASLSIPDFRSPEKTFQLLTQVSGRAGRALLSGEVIFQTLVPDHPTIRLAATQDFESFYQATLLERRQFNYPPFCRLIKVLFTASDGEKAMELASAAHKHLQTSLPSNVEIFPPVPSGHPKVNDLYRFQFLIKTAKISHALPYLKQIRGAAKIDVDPLATYF